MARQRHTVPVGGSPTRPNSLSEALAAASQGLPAHELMYIKQVLVPRVLANLASRGIVCCGEPVARPEEGAQSGTTESEDSRTAVCQLYDQTRVGGQTEASGQAAATQPRKRILKNDVTCVSAA